MKTTLKIIINITLIVICMIAIKTISDNSYNKGYKNGYKVKLEENCVKDTMEVM